MATIYAMRSAKAKNSTVIPGERRMRSMRREVKGTQVENRNTEKRHSKERLRIAP
jgi:hypothetical protein